MYYTLQFENVVHKYCYNEILCAILHNKSIKIIWKRIVEE